MVLHYKDQHYKSIKARCQRDGRLFEDSAFPASDQSLFYSRNPPPGVVWKRPQELVQSPHLFAEGGISPRDLQQGSLGNCWFVAAASCLAGDESVWKKVIPSPHEQDWPTSASHTHAGVFRFRLWRFGQWVELVIDDRLPTVGGELLFCRPERKGGAFWCALLEKAYAKLNGSYEALDGGSTAEALIDFTGGISEPIKLLEENLGSDVEKKKKLFKALIKAYSRSSLISASIRPYPGQSEEEVLSSGLVTGHAYSVTSVRSITLRSGLLSLFQTHKLRLIRLRNPWGSGEWTGAWSDGSEEWKRVSHSQRKKMGVTVSDDGEFWMSWDDFCTHFTDLTLCRRVNTSFLSTHKTWTQESAMSAWNQDPSPLKDRSGGCPNYKETYLHNPQFSFDVTLDQDCALISLEQEDRRTQRSSGQGGNLPIGFFVFKVEVNRKYRLHRTPCRVSSSTYINSRSVFLRTELQKGRYVILPTTYSPGQTGSFLLRVYTDKASQLRELTQDVPKPSWLSCCLGTPRLVTSVTVHAASGLSVLGKNQDPAVHVTIHCEGKKVTSRTVRGRNPEFDLKGVFYRKREQRPIVVQVWQSNCLRDTLLGSVSVPCTAGEIDQTSVLKIQGKEGRSAGYIMIETSTSSDLTML
ncbi:calpain-5-like [Bombina bombina]|uniref:calpain-5-like n=1 Tax=Bombina bombina TaxID=8345 RepID=UPI00235B29B2|nr:calpain-5-like [Bombina bombina]XP_053574235.1 calpain-5-like [Bombina bombina]